jgi:hypothetical protein
LDILAIESDDFRCGVLVPQWGHSQNDSGGRRLDDLRGMSSTSLTGSGMMALFQVFGLKNLFELGLPVTKAQPQTTAACGRFRFPKLSNTQ